MASPSISWFDALDTKPYIHPRSPRGMMSVLRLLEWSHEGHRYRAELRDVSGKQVWFVGCDDELPREAFEGSDDDANEDALRERLVRTVKE